MEAAAVCLPSLALQRAPSARDRDRCYVADGWMEASVAACQAPSCTPRGAACEAPNALEILDCVTKGLKLEAEAEVRCRRCRAALPW